jgi:RHH-type proline utilization regulon transcriptional repressor/proline dehydrogenase/delta 1-pyrroline-5-carboxylate dehydrogenase
LNCRACTAEENACADQRIEQAAQARKVSEGAAAFAIDLIEGARAHKASGIDAFPQQYGQ